MDSTLTPNSDSDIEDEIKRFANMIKSTDKAVQFEGLVGLRKLISTNDDRKFSFQLSSSLTILQQ